MRKFVFCDISDYEKELLTDLLHSEGIKYIIKREYIEIPCDCDDEDCECFDILPNYHIEVYTTAEKFEFMKVLFKKKMAEKEWLEKCFVAKLDDGKPKKVKRKKAVKK